MQTLTTANVPAINTTVRVTIVRNGHAETFTGEVTGRDWYFDQISSIRVTRTFQSGNRRDYTVNARWDDTFEVI